MMEDFDKHWADAIERHKRYSRTDRIMLALCFTLGFAGTVAFIAACWMLARTAGIAP